MMTRIGPYLVLGLLLSVFVWTGWRGLDFGHHWDEQFALEQISRPLESGVFMPASYNYPSMVFDIGTVALLPRTIPFLVLTTKESTPNHSQPYREVVHKERLEPLVGFARSQPFLLRLRAIFLILTSLTGIWVFLAVRACNRSGWEAVFASAVVLTSWEIAYHARWVAPDALQMQFVALWLMFFALALSSAPRRLLWLGLSAASAGLACGTKYQGGILLVPVVIYSAVAVRASSQSRPILAMAKALIYTIGIFTACFIISTPGVLLQPLIFCQALRHMSHVYATGHFGHTVGAFSEHGYLLLVYLTCVLTSHWPIIALVLSAVACLGVVMITKESPLRAMLFLFVPLVFVFYMACFRVMIVRNYLLLAPFIAFFAARGAFHIWEALVSAVWLRRIVVSGFVTLFAFNATFLYLASETIRPGVVKFGPDIVTYLKKHSGEQYLLSPKVAIAVASQNATLSNVTLDPNLAKRYLLFAQEGAPEAYICNRLGQYQYVAGPLEVNSDYYPDWQGEARVFGVPMERARAMQLVRRQ